MAFPQHNSLKRIKKSLVKGSDPKLNQTWTSKLHHIPFEMTALALRSSENLPKVETPSEENY